MALLKDSALIVIDMQRHFLASHPDWLIENICQKIKNFKEKNCPIYVLEYVGYGSTLFPIYDLLCDYPKFYLLEKEEDDGSKEIVRHFKKNGIPKHVYLTGVNADACVLETATGFKKRPFWQILGKPFGGGMKVFIFEDCVNTDCKQCAREELPLYLKTICPTYINIAT